MQGPHIATYADRAKAIVAQARGKCNRQNREVVFMPVYKVAGEKRNGLQKYRVVVNYTSDGKKQTKETLVYGKTQAEIAEARLRAAVGAAPSKSRSGEHRSPQSPAEMTVRKYYDWYETEHGPEIRASTKAKKRSIVETHILPDLGEIRLCDLTEADLEAWRSRLNAAPKKVNTKNGAYRELRALLNYAVEKKIIETSPLRFIKPFRDPYAETAAVKIRYYTKSEFLRYIEAGKKAVERQDTLTAWGTWVFFMLAYYTGARKGEINALRWSDVLGNTIQIKRSVTQKIKGQAWIETPPKNQSSVRRLQMPKPLIEALDEHRERQKRAEGWNESLFICGGPRPIPDTTLEKANARWAESAGLAHITIHEFRHSHASLLCNAGINIQEVARRLGHADPQMTLKTYAHLYPQEEERAVAVLNE